MCRETQVEETQTEENAGQTSELPIKTLTPKVMDVNPYMAASDSNIHHDCYNTDSTDEVLPVDIYSEINVSYEKVNPNASPAVFLIPMDILWFRFWVAWRSVILMQMRHRPWAIFHQNSMTMEAI
ncbi:MAG: hypothetical protein ACLUAL_00950 [Blautia wexlerae]